MNTQTKSNKAYVVALREFRGDTYYYLLNEDRWNEFGGDNVKFVEEMQGEFEFPCFHSMKEVMTHLEKNNLELVDSYDGITY